jgi:hypothetical protein
MASAVFRNFEEVERSVDQRKEIRTEIKPKVVERQNQTGPDSESKRERERERERERGERFRRDDKKDE